MKQKLCLVLVLTMLAAHVVLASKIFIPMDATGQTNHLKAYGIAYAAMQAGLKVDWLLNYKGGSYGIEYDKEIENMCLLRDVSYTKMKNKEYALILSEVNDPSFDGQVVKLEKAPKIAVYTPPGKEPWDDAVTLALTYAEIPFDKIYVDEVLAGNLDKYDWVHLHHEDFTGQYGKFWVQFRFMDWYKNDQQTMEALAAKHGYKKVSQMQLAVVKKIRDFVGSGGNMFAMCSATETFDIALAAETADICPEQFDGDPMDPGAQNKLDFNNCLAFQNFTITTSPYEYGHSNIDNSNYRHVPVRNDKFKLVSAPGKMDAIPVMLCQNHTNTIEGFMGQTTAFRKDVIKPDVMVLGDRIQVGARHQIDSNELKTDYYIQDYEAKYIHGEYGKGTWTFLGGHDPEAYVHHVYDPVTDLSKYPNSPGYRLILNNVLFPSAKLLVVPTVIMDTAARKDAGIAASAPVVNNFSMYPNPANDELVISRSSDNIEQVTVMNIAGQEVFSQSYNAGTVNVDVRSFTPGVYLVKVNGEYIGKVVKN